MAKKNQATGPTISKKQLNKMLSKEGKVSTAFLLHQRLKFNPTSPTHKTQI
jgi:hypothetical protein